MIIQTNLNEETNGTKEMEKAMRSLKLGEKFKDERTEKEGTPEKRSTQVSEETIERQRRAGFDSRDTKANCGFS